MTLASLPGLKTPSPSSPTPSGDGEADDLADRLERALDADVKLLALTLDERALLLSALEDPPQELAELRAVLLADRQSDRKAA